MGRKTISGWLIFALAGLSMAFGAGCATAAIPPHTQAVPGGLVVVPLEVGGNRPPVAHFLNNRVMIQWHDRQWNAVVGIPLNLPPGTYPLHVQTSPEKLPRNMPITIAPAAYPEAQVKSEPATEKQPDKAQARRDRREIVLALRRWEERARVAAAFALPVDGTLSKPFGLPVDGGAHAGGRNGGIDLAAAAQAPVHAAAPGVVITHSEYVYQGKTVFIDHGQGLVTMYSHLDSIAVKPGQKVGQGDVIGRAGNSGVADGPLLHWAVALNGTLVNPELFLSRPVPLADPSPAASQGASRDGLPSLAPP